MVKSLTSTTMVTFPLFWEIANGCGGTAPSLLIPLLHGNTDLSKVVGFVYHTFRNPKIGILDTEDLQKKFHCCNIY